jgi:hypothetical protein
MLKLKLLLNYLLEIKSTLFSIPISVIILQTCLMFSCDNPTEPPDKPITIPTTEAKGPGGPAYLWGNVKDYVHPQNAVTNIQVSIMNQQNYADTILSIFVNSTDGSFKLTDLPIGKYDIIFESENHLCAKLGKLNFVAQENSFNNPYSSGYFVDSTIYITNIKDSVGRPDAPPFGLQGYIAGLSVYFKQETMDSIAWQIFKNSQCDTLHVYHFNDPIFDPFENDVYILKCTDLDFVNNALVFFNYKNEVLYASPNYEFTEQ